MSATQLWVKDYDCAKLTKEFSAIGEKYQLVLNGKRAVLNTLGFTIARDETYLRFIPGLSSAVQALIPNDVLARTPRLDWDGAGENATLTVTGERGLINGDVALGSITSNDAYTMPPNATCRFTYEPNDVELSYGLPFRKNYKWDLTVTAPNLTFAVDKTGIPSVEEEYYSSITTIANLLSSLGYTTSISLMAICNIWSDGSVTEIQRGLLFQYLNNASGGGIASKEYIDRYLRGQKSYRFWVPTVSTTLRFRRLPNNSYYVPTPGQVFAAGATGGPPLWTNAPVNYVPADGISIPYKYLRTGPQLDFAGEQWVVETQWAGFVEYDEPIYTNPKP